MIRRLLLALLLLAAPLGAAQAPHFFNIAFADLVTPCRPGRLFGINDSTSTSVCGAGGAVAAICQCDGDGLGYTAAGDLSSGVTGDVQLSDGSGGFTTATATGSLHYDSGESLVDIDTDLVVLGVVGMGGGSLAAAACVANDADRLFHDTNCDNAKDAGEEYIDFTLFSATDLDTDYGNETITSDFNFNGGTLGLPSVTDCSGVTVEGDICWDSDGDALCVGNGFGGCTSVTVCGSDREFQFNDGGACGSHSTMYFDGASNEVLFLQSFVTGGPVDQLQFRLVGAASPQNLDLFKIEHLDATELIVVEGSGDMFIDSVIGLGSTTLASAACVANDASDRLFHDTDCDETKDAGEEFIDAVDTDTNANTICSGTGNYLDGEGNCDPLVTFPGFTDLDTNYGAETITSDFNFNGGTLGLPAVTDCSGVTVDGDVCWDSDGDALCVGDGTACVSVGSGPGVPSVSGAQAWLRMTSDEVTVGGVTEQIDWEAESRDDLDWHDNSTNPSRVTVDADGWYLLDVGLRFDDSETVNIWTKINGTAIQGTGMVSGDSLMFGQHHAIHYMSSGDYLEVAVKTATAAVVDGVDNNSSSWMHLTRLPSAPAYSGAQAELRDTTDQAIGAATPTAVDWNTEVRDDLNWHDNSTNPSRVTADADGWYHAMCSIRFREAETGGSVSIALNGASVKTTVAANPAQFERIHNNHLIEMSSGDYLECWAWANGAINVDTGDDTGNSSFVVTRLPTASDGSNLTVQESDGTPSIDNVVDLIAFDQDQGFTVTDDGSGDVTIGVTHQAHVWHSWRAGSAWGNTNMILGAVALPTQSNHAGTNLQVRTNDFDSATDECAGAENFRLPQNLDTSGTVRFSVSWFLDTVEPVGRAVVWDIRELAVAEDETWDQAHATHTFATDAPTITVDLIEDSTVLKTVSTLDWVAGDWVSLFVCRDADNGSDSLGQDAHATQLTIEVPVSE